MPAVAFARTTTGGATPALARGDASAFESGLKTTSRSNSRPALLGSCLGQSSRAAFSVAAGTAIDRRYWLCGSHGLTRGRRSAAAHVRAGDLPGSTRVREPGRSPRRGREPPPGHRGQLPEGDPALVDAHGWRDHRSRPRPRSEDGSPLALLLLHDDHGALRVV